MLRLRIRRYIATLPLYDVGMISLPRDRWDTSPSRLSKIYPEHHGGCSTLDSLRQKSKWQLLYIQTGSYVRSETPIYLALNHPFPPSLQLPDHVIASFLNYRDITNWKIKHSQLPWSGPPPRTITFR